MKTSPSAIALRPRSLAIRDMREGDGGPASRGHGAVSEQTRTERPRSWREGRRALVGETIRSAPPNRSAWPNRRTTARRSAASPPGTPPSTRSGGWQLGGRSSRDRLHTTASRASLAAASNGRQAGSTTENSRTATRLCCPPAASTTFPESCPDHRCPVCRRRHPRAVAPAAAQCSIWGRFPGFSV